MASSTEVDAFLDRLPDDQRAALQDLRETISAAAPDATEAISMGSRPSSTEAGRS